MTDIPEGFMENSRGGLDRIEMVKPVDMLRDQTVHTIIEKAKKTSDTLARFKASAMEDVEEFIATSAEEYGAKMGGQKGNVTLTSYDGRYKVVRSVQERIDFDERLKAAQFLIKECINEWGAGAKPEIMTLINDAFEVDDKGNVSTTRVLGLRRLNIADEKWQKAMQAIADSMRVSGSKSYIRIYERDDKTGSYVPVPLDVAAA